jgi:hypothetical protein
MQERNPDGSTTTRLESGAVAPGTYVLYIFGRTPWFSGQFDVGPGETKLLRPEISDPASLRARIIDSADNPIAGAVISQASGTPGLIAFRGLIDENPGEAISGADGTLTLEGHPPGTFKFQVFAHGYQPWEGFVTLVAGQDYDMHDIRLEAARGRVEVRLPEWDYAKRKVAWALVYADGAEAAPRGTVESNKLVIERLPVGRTYSLQLQIVTRGGNLSSLWYPKQFELTHAATSRVLDGTHLKWPDHAD